MKLKNACSLEVRLWQTYTAYQKAETLLCWQRSIYSKLWYFQQLCENWTIKKAQCWRTDAFELWCWRRLFRVPWTARRSNQTILKEINPEHSLAGLMLKLMCQYSGHVMQRVDSLEETLKLGRIEGKRRSGWQRMRWLDSNTDSMDMNLSKCPEIVDPSVLQSMKLQRVRPDWGTERELV